MEHIVQFAVGIDDKAITDRVEMSAEKQIIEHLEQEVRNKLFDSRTWARDAKPGDPLSAYSERIINNFLEANKNDILEKAAKYLAEKLARSKAGKALLNDV